MNRLGLAPLFFAITVVFGALGTLSVDLDTARAAGAGEIYVQPGSVRDELRCGFHTVCLPPIAFGQGLDWGNYAGNSVYFRAYGTRDDLSTGKILTGYVGQRDGNCRQVVVDLVSLSGTYRGRVEYTHSILSGTEGRTFNIYGRDSGYFNSYGPVGTTAYDKPSQQNQQQWNQELWGCASSGPHLHQSASYASWYANTGMYPAQQDLWPYWYGYDPLIWANWQNRTSWID